jgi:hypothetical protein
VVAHQTDQLDLEGRERRQRAAEAGAEQRPPEGRGRQPLLQPRDEVAEQAGADDVGGERRPRPAAPVPRQQLAEPGAGERARDAAGEDRQLEPAAATRSPAGRRRGGLDRRVEQGGLLAAGTRRRYSAASPAPRENR